MVPDLLELTISWIVKGCNLHLVNGLQVPKTCWRLFCSIFFPFGRHRTLVYDHSGVQARVMLEIFPTPSYGLYNLILSKNRFRVENAWKTFCIAKRQFRRLATSPVVGDRSVFYSFSNSDSFLSIPDYFLINRVPGPPLFQ